MKSSVNTISKNQNKRIILIMLPVCVFLFADIFAENFITKIYDSQARSSYYLVIFCLLQIIFAPIQSGLSDIYGRKKSLIISLFFSFLSIVCINLFNRIEHSIYLILATFLKGATGNTLPIALAVIADTRSKNYRLLFAFATAAYAFAYLGLAWVSNPIDVTEKVIDIKIEYYLGLVFIFLILFCFFLFNRFINKKRLVKVNPTGSVLSILEHEPKLLAQDVAHVPTRKALTAFFLWETSLYTILISQVDFQIGKPTHIAELMMIGYLVGVFILLCCKNFKDSTVIKMGYWVSFLSLIPYFLLFKFVEDKISLLQSCCFFHALGNAFLSPALLSILAKPLKAHEQGRMYGLTDSVDTLAFLIGNLVISAITKELGLGTDYLVMFSFIIFTVSWIFYNRFQNHKKSYGV